MNDESKVTKRFSFVSYTHPYVSAEMVEDNDGEFVTHADYEALEEDRLFHQLQSDMRRQIIERLTEELNSEVARYKSALTEIAGKEGELPWSRAACESIARNALRERT